MLGAPRDTSAGPVRWPVMHSVLHSVLHSALHSVLHSVLLGRNTGRAQYNSDRNCGDGGLDRTLFGRHGYAIIKGLVGLLQDEADNVKLCAMGALRMLSESRDGCDLLLDADSIVGLGSCLSEMKRQPALLGEALFSLGNMTKMEAAIKQAMDAKIVEKLVALLSEGEEDGIQMQALVLKCIWNICNMDAGKLAVIDAGGTDPPTHFPSIPPSLPSSHRLVFPRPAVQATLRASSPHPPYAALRLRMRRCGAHCTVPPVARRGHPPAVCRGSAGNSCRAGGERSRDQGVPASPSIAPHSTTPL